MDTKNWPAFPRANVSVLGAMQTVESSVTNGPSGPAKTASAEHYSGAVAVCIVKLHCTPPCASVSTTGAPNTVGSQHLQRAKPQACVPDPSASGMFGSTT